MLSLRSIYLLLFILLSSVHLSADERGVNCINPNLYEPKIGESPKPRMKTLAREAREGYECRLIEFSLEGGEIAEVRDDERVKAYLLVPDGASVLKKRPAILMLHDHGARFDIGKEKLVRPISAPSTIGGHEYIRISSRQWVDVNFDGVYLADSLASCGYVVLVSDALYWGDRSSEDARLWSRMNYDDSFEFSDSAERKNIIKSQKKLVYEGQREVYDSLRSEGIIWAEKILRDDVASARLLARLPFVDRKSIGAFGFSMGAHRCWLLAAFCDEIKCGVALSWMTSLEGYEGNNASDLSMRIQPMRDQIDFGDIGIWLRPKPMLFLNGVSDHLFPRDKVEAAFRKLQRHYSAQEYEPNFEPLQTVFFNGGHHCGKDVQETIIYFFEQNLK